jgi:protein tyrosine/serine phosphatase
MSAILDCIDQALAGEHKLYLHCWAGIGRTGTTVGCYLVRHGLSGEQALGKLAEMYATSSQSRLYSHSPENPAQFDFIRNWHEE